MLRTIPQLLTQTFKHWKKHNAQRMGAALAYYAVFSLVPFAFLMLSLLSLFFSVEDIRELLSSLSSGAAQENLRYVLNLASSLHLGDSSVFVLAIGIVALIVTAATAFSELKGDLRELWMEDNADEKETLKESIKSSVHQRVILVGLLFLISMLVFAAMFLQLLFGFMVNLLVNTEINIIVRVLQYVLPMVLSISLFITIYRVIPEQKLPWRELFIGAAITALMVFIGNIAISKYIEHGATVDRFGTAGSLVGLLLWVYYSAQVFYFGAALTYVRAKNK